MSKNVFPQKITESILAQFQGDTNSYCDF